MSNKIWVIRGSHFGYNDDYFYVAGSTIDSTYDNQTDAEEAYKQLEVAAARQFPLAEVAVFFEGTPEFLQRMYTFVFERCGHHIIQANQVINDILPEDLSDDDTFEFVKQAGMTTYQLLSFDGEPKFYALWLPEQEGYYATQDEFVSYLAYSQNSADLYAHLEELPYEFKNEKIIRKGSLAELSTQPVLLEQAIKAHADSVTYNSKKKELSFKGMNKDMVHALMAINPLLQQPIYEIHELTLAQIQELEQLLMAAANANWDDDEDEEDDNDEFDK